MLAIKLNPTNHDFTSSRCNIIVKFNAVTHARPLPPSPSHMPACMKSFEVYHMQSDCPAHACCFDQWPVVCIKGKKRYAICIAPQVNYSTSEALSMDHTAFYTANTPCRLYRVVRQRAPIVAQKQYFNRKCINNKPKTKECWFAPVCAICTLLSTFQWHSRFCSLQNKIHNLHQ